MKKQVLFILLFCFSVLVWAGKPNNAQVVSVAATQATVSWGNGTCGSIDYVLQYRDSALAGSWISISNIANSSGTTSYTITALNSSTTYEWKVRCGGNWRVGPNFTTLSANPAITNVGNTFSPDTLFVNTGDTISFNISGSHNAVEVSQSTWLANGLAPNGGFSIPYGGGTWIVNSAQTYYYVCQPHASMGMKGVIIATSSCVNTSSSDTVSACNTYTWNGNTYTASGVYVDSSFTNAEGCDSVATLHLTINSISSTISIIDASCNNTLDGGANLTAVGGTPPLAFSWNNGVTNEDLTAVGSGTYIVTITDANNCTAEDTAVIDYIGNKSVTQNVSSFAPNPLTGSNIWSYDTLSILNTGCDVNVRPEFIVSHQDSAIQQGDFEIRWKNPIIGFVNIPYTIVNGKAHGYWSPVSNPQDSTGYAITVGSIQEVIIRVKFFNTANTGTYTAAWQTFEVDGLGNKIQALAAVDSVPLSLVSCNNFSIDNVSSTATTCNAGSDGSATVVSVINGSGSYSYLWNNGQTNATASNLSAGSYTITVTDNNSGCVDSANVVISEPAVLSHSLSSINNTCGNTCSGSIAINLTGGGFALFLQLEYW